MTNRIKNFFKDRNLWVSASDEEFAKFCRIENFQDTGKGGQKRNRKYSGVRLTHIETGIVAECALHREQNFNRVEAGKKLRLKIAMLLSGPKIVNVRPIVSLDHHDYPCWVSFVLDELYSCDFEIFRIAEKLTISKTKLTKLLYKDRGLWDEVNANREELGKFALAL
ncbi:MAG: peptide chain release factor-like protein [Lentisphaerota bacterium]